ncbi:MAG: MATE family efflux transporter, partial [Wujia sp.]
MEKNLTTGNILKNLILFSLPYLLSCFLQSFYGLADLFITGQFNGSEAVSAVSIGSQIMHMVTVIIVGLAMGTTVLISQSIGAQNKKRAAHIIGNSTVLFLGISFVLTILLLSFIDPIITVMRVPSAAVDETHRYLTICFIGIPCITAYNIISCIFRGLGDTKSPMYFIGIACVINVILDYVLIGIFGLSSAGAAYGTVISQTISVICALVSIRKMGIGIRPDKKDYIPDKTTLSEIIKIGIPVSLQDGLIQVSFIIITIIANDRGLIISTSVGIVEKIISFLFLVPSALLASVSAIAAQNVGAGNHKRARTTLKYATIIAVSVGLFFALICQFTAPFIIDLFSDDKEVIRMGAQYLRTYSFDCAIAGIHFCFSGFFCAYGKSIISFIHNIISVILVRVPGAYLASIYFPDSLTQMGMAAPLGSLLSAF